jgi:transposase-like protein
MNIPPLARTSPRSRAELVRRVLDLHEPVAAVAAAFGISQRTVFKWLAGWRVEGEAGLRERSSRPKCSPQTSSPPLVARVLALRRLRLPAFQISAQTATSY